MARPVRLDKKNIVLLIIFGFSLFGGWLGLFLAEEVPPSSVDCFDRRGNVIMGVSCVSEGVSLVESQIAGVVRGFLIFFLLAIFGMFVFIRCRGGERQFTLRGWEEEDVR